MTSLRRQRVAQRQDSLHDQMRDVIRLAEREGCYDAADWLKAQFPTKYGDFIDRVVAGQEDDK